MKILVSARALAMRRHPGIGALPSAVLLLALLMLSQAGCSLPGAQTNVSGLVMGQDATAMQNGGQSAATAVQGTIACNGVSAKTDHAGHFVLALPPSKAYRCTVTAPNYQSETVQLNSGSDQALTGDRLTLDFSAAVTSPGQASECPAPSGVRSGDQSLQCPQLALEPGTVRGTVSSGVGGAAVGSATVECADANKPIAQAGASAAWLTTKSAADGTYTLGHLSVGTYGCVATTPAGGATYQRVVISPGVTVSASFQTCPGGCPRMHYHGGSVIHSATAYVIYWLPSGYTLDPGRSDTAFRGLIERYFHDISGSALYGMLSQYFDQRGPIQNQVTLAGTYTDATPYQHCTAAKSTSCTPAHATVSDPLTDDDVQAEVARVIASQHWTAGPDAQFYVLLGASAHACDGSGHGSDSCTFLQNDYALCGYHSWYAQPAGTPVIYAMIADAHTEPRACLYPISNVVGSSPNGNWYADAEISSLSHEQFESVTDPQPTGPAGGWYDDHGDLSGQSIDEIGDVCQDYWGNPDYTGADVRMPNGDGYVLQGEWSDRAGGCVLG